MFAALHALTLLALLTVIVMEWFGLNPKTASGATQWLHGFLLLVIVAGTVSALWRMVVTNARRVEATGIDEAAAPVRAFGYRRQKLAAGFVFFWSAVLAAPLLLVWPLLWAVAPAAAAHPAIPLMSAFLFLLAGLLFVVARRYWFARVVVYPDRLGVRGIYSNGSVRWNDARLFLHEQLPAGEWNTMWVYFLCADGHEVRVEYTVDDAAAFVQEVEARTGLKLEERPIGWQPQPEPAKRGHEAFRR